MLNDPTIEELWRLPPKEFNQWRREHDLPKLLSFLKRCMPHFQEWLDLQEITDQDFLHLNRPSQLFIGERTAHLVRATDTEGENHFFVSDLSQNDLHIEHLKTWGFPMMDKSESREFTPYFFWLRQKTGTSYFRTPGTKESERSFSRGFAFMAGQGGTGHHYSRVFLFRNHEVLKLGSVKIKAMDFNGRNLDFVDLDGLHISGRARDDSLGNPHVTFSSCKKMTFSNCNRPFTTFDHCALEDFTVENSSMQDLHFIDCTLMTSRFSTSELRLLTFLRTSAWPLFQECEVSETRVIERHRGAQSGSNANLFKSLRTATQQRGQRGAAGNFFYRERKEEMLTTIYSRLFPYDPSLPQRKYSMPLRDLKERITAGQYDKEIQREWIVGYVVFFLQSLTTARAWYYILRKIWKIAAEALDWMLWGFGERPARIFGWVLLSLIGFFGYLIVAKDQSIGIAATCAMGALTGSTCTELSDPSGKLIASVYSVGGAILFGLLLAGFANRTRY